MPKDLTSYIVHDISDTNKITSLLNIIRTLFIMSIIVTGIVMFNNDANRLVLGPIERLSEKVKIMA